MAIPEAITVAATMELDSDEELLQRMRQNNKKFNSTMMSLKKGLKVAENMAKRAQNNKKAEEERLEKLEKAKLEAKQKEKEEEEAAAAGGEADNTDAAFEQAIADSTDDDPEPPSSDEHILAPPEQDEEPCHGPAIDLTCIQNLDIPELQGQEPGAVLDVLLQQGVLLEVLGRGTDVLQLLFRRVVTQGCEFAASELVYLYQRHDIGASWAPSLQDFNAALRQAGYKIQVRNAKNENNAETDRNSQEEGGAQNGEGDTDMQDASDVHEARRRRSACLRIQLILRILTAVCRSTGDLQQTGSHLTFSREEKDAGVQLLIALMELQLVPSLRRAALLELQSSLAGLVNAWATCGSSTWSSAVTEVSARVPYLGPSHRAALSAIQALQDCSRPMQQLQVACALSLQASLLSKEVTAAEYSESASTTMKLLPDVTSIRTVMHREGRPNKPDYYRILTMLDCTFLVLWPLAYTHQDEEAIRQGHAFQAYLNKLGNAIQRGRTPTGSLVEAACSEISNQFEFGLPHNDKHQTDD